MVPVFQYLLIYLRITTMHDASSANAVPYTIASSSEASSSFTFEPSAITLAASYGCDGILILVLRTAPH
jgi:hypothetical protein